MSSSSQSASAIYLTTLATPALLLKEAGAEVLKDALGLNQGGRPSSSSSSRPPPVRLAGDDFFQLKEGSEREGRDGDDDDEEEGEEFATRRTGSLSSTHCDCNNVLQESV